MPKQTSKATQQFVDIEEIKDGLVILKNGGIRRILMASGINFELKSEEEQNAILYAYQNFLNSLDFSLQIVVHSRRLNIDIYLKKLRERESTETNELLRNQIDEYIQFINSFISENEIMTKTFFVVVPYDTIQLPKGGQKVFQLVKGGAQNNSSTISQSFEEKVHQLDQRTDQVIYGLNQIGLRAVPLNDDELIELFYNLYNPSVKKKELEIAEE
jgi:type IV secretory pathway VirB4 component